MNVNPIAPSYAPGPKGHWLLGSAKNFSHNYGEFLLEQQRVYGDMVHFRLGPQHVHSLNHPDFVADVLLDRAQLFRKAPQTNGLLRRFLGDSFLTLEGEASKRQRRFVTPAFHRQRIAGYAKAIVQKTEQLLSRWTPEQTLDVVAQMRSLTMSIVTKVMLDVDEGPAERRIAEIAARCEHYFLVLINTPLPVPAWVPTAANRGLKAAREELDTLVLTVIADRHKAAGEDRHDLLSMMLIATEDGKTLSDAELLAEVKTMYIAGFDTTAQALIWVWHVLSQHPQIAAKLKSELNAVLRGRAPNIEDLPQLRFTEQLIKETLRVYPAVAAFTRSPIQDTVIGGFKVQKGDLIWIPPVVLHQDSRFFSDPQAFTPERWTPEFEKALPRGAYIPFSAGSRICIAWQFAMIEMILIVATIAQVFKLESIPGQTVVPQPMITNGPKNGLKARAIPV